MPGTLLPRGLFGRYPAAGNLGLGLGLPPEGLVIPPGMELYLDSRLGITLADNAPFGNTAPNLWGDQSGNARNAGTQGLLGPKPRYHTTGPLLTTNGSPIVNWNGTMDALGNIAPNPLPSIANGYTIFAYGRFKPTGAPTCSILFQDTLGGSPQLGWEDSPGKRYFKRDATGTQFGLGFGGVAVYGALAFQFQPPALTNPAICTLNGVQKFSLSWNWNPAISSGYLIGTNQVGNCAMDCDLAALLWYSRYLTNQEIALLTLYFQIRFGA